MDFRSTRRGSARPSDVSSHNYDPNITAPYDEGPAYSSYVSDPTHPDYDPSIDPALQLRTVRTAAASIAESHRSDARRDERRKERKAALLGRLGRGRTFRKKEGKVGGLAALIQEERTRDYGASGTGGEGIGVPFESAQQDHTPLTPVAGSSTAAISEAQEELRITKEGQPGSAKSPGRKGKAAPQRRNVYLNIPLPHHESDRKGEPLAKYPRNRVCTSKYNVVTFLPKFLFEQFRRIANVYFLGLVVISIPSTFGATIPQIAMLPLVLILGLTAIKDGIEDHRRHVIDNGVNNSAVTKLGNWRNVNQPKDPRTWFEKLFGLTGRGDAKVSKGVRKLREKEDAIGLSAMKQSSATMASRGNAFVGGSETARTDSRTTGPGGDGERWGLDTIASETERGDEEYTDLSRSTWGQPAVSQEASAQRPTPGRMASQASLGNRRGPAFQQGGPSSGVFDHRRSIAGTSRWERTLWKKLEVGDIVLLREDEQVPADIIVLNSSGEDGIVFVETKNLDGETNLKPRKSVKATRGLQSEEDVEASQFVIDVEPPHANLYAFNAVLKYSTSSATDEEKSAPVDSSAFAAAQAQSKQIVEPIGINELLLRGCAIRNTEWVIGIVAFTGSDTKIMLNSGETPSKRSKIEKETNWNVVANFVLLLALCSICAIVGGYRLDAADRSMAYYEPDVLDSSSNIVNALIIFGSCLILFQNIVPISLYISIELVKSIQAYFIYQDADMYYAPLDQPCLVKSFSLSDDLGQIEYIFSDKTGTLTQNIMEFKKCSINGVSYGEGITEAQIGAMKREGKDVSGFSAEVQMAQLEESKQRMVQTMTRSYQSRYLREDKLTLISPKLADDLAPASAADEQRRNVIAFFRALALCHTALTDRPDGTDPFTLDYKAESPDESALVAAARDVGAVFLNKTTQQVDIEVMGQPERYTPLNILEFNSTRKRMSVIVREPEGRILLLAKGADSVIYQRLRSDHPQKLREETQNHLEEYANSGLRTLCIAYRYLEEHEYAQWAQQYAEAAAATVDREDKIDEASELIEHSLTLLGATALEDKLQEGVPEAIAQLHEAGIKLWVLTGDKMQTAIEIGFSCNLLNAETEVMIISADHEAGIRAQMEAACNKIAAAGRPVLVEGAGKGLFKKKQPGLGFQPNPDAAVNTAGDASKTTFGVVIDGDGLRYALDPALKPLFLALTTQCETVICCRVSPAQKALTVKLVKDGKDAMTLAIGDGANDVSMIQEAHIGVGIAGLEGAQASMSADYAIGQFRFLTKLLIVHGHWSYRRIADLQKSFFFKNVIWTFTTFWYQIFCDFNATYIYDYSYILLFNLVFTSLPVVVLGALDQDCNAKALMAFPQTYTRGIKGLDYNRTLFWIAIGDGVYQSVVCFFVTYACWRFFPVVNADGHEMDGLWMFGTTVGAGAVVSANLYVGLSSSYWSVIVWGVQFISSISYFAWALIYSAFPGTAYQNTAFWLMSTVTFWAQILLIIVLSLLPRFYAKAWRVWFMPTEVDLVREAWIKGDLKKRLGLKDRPDASMTDVQTGHDTDEELTSRDQVFPPGSPYDPQSTPRPDGVGRAQSDKSPNLSTHNANLWGDGRGTQMSYYDPDMIGQDSTSSSPRQHRRSKTPEALGREAFGSARHEAPLSRDEQRSAWNQTPVPEIHIQRASGATSSFYPYGDSERSHSDDEEGYQYDEEEEAEEEQERRRGAARSTFALVDDVAAVSGRGGAARASTDASGDSAAGRSNIVYSPPRLVDRWHNRFAADDAAANTSLEENDDASFTSVGTLKNGQGSSSTSTSAQILKPAPPLAEEQTATTSIAAATGAGTDSPARPPRHRARTESSDDAANMSFHSAESARDGLFAPQEEEDEQDQGHVWR